jgi:hypothetical protein
MGKPEMPPIYGYRELWSKDRTKLIQEFSDLEKGSILTVFVSSRRASWARWESITEVGPPSETTTRRDDPHNVPNDH